MQAGTHEPSMHSHLAAHSALVVPQLQHAVDATPRASHALAAATAAACAAVLPAQHCALQLAVQLH